MSGQYIMWHGLVDMVHRKSKIPQWHIREGLAMPLGYMSLNIYNAIAIIGRGSKTKLSVLSDWRGMALILSLSTPLRVISCPVMQLEQQVKKMF